MRHTYRVRAGLVAAAALLALLVVIQPGHSQSRGGPPLVPPRPPGGPGDFIRPPTIPEPPRPPEFPRPPTFPTPPPIGGGGIGGGVGGGIPGGPIIYEWTCSICGAHLGTGPTAPAINRCPRCGAILNGSQIVNGPGAGGMVPPPTPRVGPANVGPPPMAANGPVFNGGVNVASSESEDSATERKLNMARIIVITLGALVLLGIGLTAVIVTLVKQQHRPRRRRPRRRYLDEDDDY